MNTNGSVSYCGYLTGESGVFQKIKRSRWRFATYDCCGGWHGKWGNLKGNETLQGQRLYTRLQFDLAPQAIDQKFGGRHEELSQTQTAAEEGFDFRFRGLTVLMADAGAREVGCEVDEIESDLQSLLAVYQHWSDWTNCITLSSIR